MADPVHIDAYLCIKDIQICIKNGEYFEIKYNTKLNSILKRRETYLILNEYTLPICSKAL